jgi:geranylgeranyl diphosphate synthase type I
VPARETSAIEPLGVVNDAVGLALDAFAAARAVELSAISPDLAPLIDAARLAVRGGKRLRAGFVYGGWRAAGGAALKSETSGQSANAPMIAAPIVNAAAAVELVHASALTHDDVMDDSATRRGRPSAHRAFATLRGRADRRAATRLIDPHRFGTNGAILLGDLLLSWSDELLSASGFRPKHIGRARPLFDKLRSEVVAGQYLDILAQDTQTVSASRAMLVVRYKSAKYTVERPLQFGAALAGGSPRLLAALSTFGVPLGEAFQLRDDLLGVFGDSDRTGKPAGDDIRDGKRTLLLARAYDAASPAQRQALDGSIGNPDLTADQLENTRAVLRETGAVRAVETVIAELTKAALASLALAPIADEETRNALAALAERATNRDV